MSVRFLVILIYLLAVCFFFAFISISQFMRNVFCFGEDSSQSFDYIIVGSGTAGAVIAQRLSADKNVSVLVLEAGGDFADLLKIPSVGLMLQQTSYDWQYLSVPQKNACYALNNNASLWPMGKIVGGSGMLNNMLHVRGHQEDFDEWFRSKKDYTFTQDILPYFRKMETDSEEDSMFYGVAHLSDPNYLTILPEFLIRAAKNLGLLDLKNPVEASIGTGIPKVYLHNGQRWTSASRLKILNQPNLVLKTNRLVEKVLFKGNFEATGVKYLHCEKSYYAKARKGVILSAGVIGSAKILMLSGIGRKQHLSDVGIKTKVELPVGDNLQDHVATGLDLVLLNTSLNLHIENILSPISAFNYFTQGTGPWTTAGCELLIYSKQNVSQNVDTSLRPDLQFMVMPLSINEDDGVYLRNLLGISDKTWYNYFSLTTTQAVTILPVVLHPKSKGTLRLKGKYVGLKPLIDPQYLSVIEDVEELIAGIEIIKKLVQSEEMRKLGASINNNIFPGCESFTFDTKEYWECYVRHLTITSYHPIGTCKMGAENDPSSVVNYNFQVKNTNKLFVSDGSVLPSLTSGNVNAAILLMAELASDQIRKTHFLETKRCDIAEIFLIKKVCDE